MAEVYFTTLSQVVTKQDERHREQACLRSRKNINKTTVSIYNEENVTELNALMQNKKSFNI